MKAFGLRLLNIRVTLQVRLRQTPDIRDRLDDLVFTGVAVVLALMGTVFGLCLLYNGITANASTSAAYQLLRGVPLWPSGAGMVYVALGAGQLYTACRDKFGTAAVLFVSSACVSSLYGALYAVGTSLDPEASFFGPQVNYIGVGMLHAVLAFYCAGRWLIERSPAGTLP